MKYVKILLVTAIIMLFVGCGGQNDQGSYTWLRGGENLEEDGLRFSVDEINHLVVNSIHNRVSIETHSGSDILIEYVPDAPGSGNYYHHVIRPRYEFANGHLEIFRDVNLAGNTFIRNGSINILVPVYDGEIFESVSVSTTSGDVRMSNFNASSVRINTTGRDVRIVNFNAGSVTASTTAGNINVLNVDVENNFTLENRSGSIDISNSRIGGQLSASTSSNDITITNVDTDFDAAELSTTQHNNIIIN